MIAPWLVPSMVMSFQIAGRPFGAVIKVVASHELSRCSHPSAVIVLGPVFG